MEWVNTIIQGVLLGGLYAMFAAGLSLIFGVMRLVNIAHGDLIVLAAYVALVTTEALGINPLLSLVIVVPLMAAVGYALQRAILNRTLGDDLLPPLLVTFGLSVIIQNGLLEFFTADSRKLNAGNIEIASIHLGGGLAVGTLPLIQFLLAIAVIAGLQWLFYRTALGRAFRATSDDQSVAQLMGLNNSHVFGLAMALSLAIVAIAGVLLLLVAPLRSWLTRTFGGAVSRHAQQSRRQDGVVDLDPDEWQRVPDRELPGRPKPPRRGEPD